MEDKKWKPICWFKCPECRGELEGFTEAEEDFFFEDDPVRCTDCGWKGRVIVVDDEAWVKEID
jgi:DNA-directed RNA polymerase subunit RPC12/RpoP